MQTFTVLQRNERIRAEQDNAIIAQLKLCGYNEVGCVEASSAEEACASQANQLSPEAKPSYPGMRKVAWIGGVVAIGWFSYLGFVLLPMAFQG
ncbi:hypothetical protein [Marinomonas communis]|jgi:hypothetical protein|uniref:hypothetical protein n=1 Tax=Marinomonas communis TaxID=28254 RepID=UPI001002794E|nr:hypothetical protein [Marinomonas communis]MCC4274096.1 hypothetical protein [Marinomonas communis]RUM52167.1 MAG: hypothetical protein DSY85_10780 [Marinomonas sp.]